MALGLYHNSSPRQELAIYGDVAVRAGKVSRRTMEQIKRMLAAHENSVDWFAFVVAAGESSCMQILFGIRAAV